MKKSIITIVLGVSLIVGCKKSDNSPQNATSNTTNEAQEINLPMESMSRNSGIWVDNNRVTFRDKKTYADFTERHLANTDSVVMVIRNLTDYNKTRGARPADNNPADEDYLDLILNGNNEVRIGNDIIELNFRDSLTLIKTLSNSVVSSHAFDSNFNYVDMDVNGNALKVTSFCNESGVSHQSSSRTINTNTPTTAFVAGCQYFNSRYEYRLQYNKFGIYFTIVYKQGIVGLAPMNPNCGSNGAQAPYTINTSNAREFQIGSLKPRCRSWQHKGPGMGGQSGNSQGWSKDRMYSSTRALNRFHIRTYSDNPLGGTTNMNSNNFTTFAGAIFLEIRRNM